MKALKAIKDYLLTYKDAFLSIVPVVVIVLIMYFTKLIDLASYPLLHGNELWLFLIGAFLILVGMKLFNKGSETSMSKIGEAVGATITKNKNIVAIIIILFLLGLFITIAEPDLTVLANQLPIPSYLLIVVVGVGVGIFMVIGVFRIIFQKSLKVWLIAFYGLIFAIVCLVDAKFIPITFDSGGVTTGPMTVPFILAVGIGVATTRGSKGKNADSFGLTAFCSLGPILVMCIFSLVLQHQGNIIVDTTPVEIVSFGSSFTKALIKSLEEVAIAIAPILVFFIIYNVFVIKFPRKVVIKILIGLLYTYIGLVLFMTGVNGGFSPVADAIGRTLGGEDTGAWFIIIFGGLIGLVTVLCEPAIHVLVVQTEQMSGGLIKKGTMLVALSIGVGTAIALSFTRIIYGFSLLYYIVPGYILALALTFFVPDIYVGVAFDSGGVASGPMTSAFISPMAVGLTAALYPGKSDMILTNAFGTIAMVALMPLIVIQLLGLSASLKKQHHLRVARALIHDANDNQIIHLG